MDNINFNPIGLNLKSLFITRNISNESWWWNGGRKKKYLFYMG